MSSLPQALQDRFAALQAAFLEQLHERMVEIDLLWPIVRVSCSPVDLKPVYIHVHSLSGSSATLGFLAISEAAQQADAFLRPLVDAGTPFSPDLIPQVELLLDSLRIAAGKSLQTAEPNTVRAAR